MAEHFRGFGAARASTPSTHGDVTRRNVRVRAASDVIVFVGILAVFGIIASLLPGVNEPIGPEGIPSTISTDLNLLPYYALRSAFRMFIALFFSLVFTFVYALAAAKSRRLRVVLIPLLDILQSVPILGFLSATITIWLVLFPGSILGVEAASIFAIFTSQAWNMTFSFYQSLMSEPKELDEAARLMRLTHWQRFWKLDVPYAMIPLLWNCMMSVGGGWFFLTASEMISVNNQTLALPGVGSFVAVASDQEDIGKICWAIVTMIIVVMLIDFLLWKPLTAWAEKFRFTQSSSAAVKTSAVLNIIRQSHVDDLLARVGHPIADFLDWATRPLGRTGERWQGTNVVRRRAGDFIFGGVVALVCVWGAVQLGLLVARNSNLSELGEAFGLGFLTFLRVLVLILVCTIIWVPIGVVIGMNPKAARIAQPIVQVLASFPANFTFPFVTLWFITWNIDLAWGSILLMALGTQWYILFNVIAGATAIPDDLREMTRSFRLGTWLRWTKLILPAVFGSWCVGGITAAGGAWNASIVAEIVSYGKHTLSTPGLGAYIADATANGDMSRSIIGVLVMSVFVVTCNRLFWNPMQRLADRRFSVGN